MFFLRSDIVHSGIFGSTGNIRLHCAIQPVDNPGDKSVLFPVDPAQTNYLKCGDLNKVVYARCSHPDPVDKTTIPLVADWEVLTFKAQRYLLDYKYHAASRCTDISGYSDLLPPSTSKSSGTTTVASAKSQSAASSKMDASKLGEKIASKHKSVRKKAAVGSNKRKTRSPSKSNKTPPATLEDAGLYSAVRIKTEDGVPVEDYVPDVTTYRKNYFEEAKGSSKLFDDSEDSSAAVDSVFSVADDSDFFNSSEATGGTTGNAEEVKRPVRKRRPTKRYEH